MVFEDWQVELIKDFKDGTWVAGLAWKYRHHYKNSAGHLMPPRKREYAIEKLIREWMINA